MYTVYYQDNQDKYLFHFQANFAELRDAVSFYNMDRPGYIKDASIDKIVVSFIADNSEGDV